MLLSLLVATAALAAQAHAGCECEARSTLLQDSDKRFSEGDTPNKFIVTYTVVPSFGKLGFFTMPRNWDEAAKMDFARVQAHDEDTEVWCRQGDYRVCVLFDGKGSAAGLMVSIATKEMLGSGAPLDPTADPHWRRHKLLGEDVHSTTVYFVDQEVLAGGGRRDLYSADGLTVPDGIYLQHTDSDGKEIRRLHVPADESAATERGFSKQNCWFGMGKHYAQGLSKTSKCEQHKPYFLMYNTKHQMVGFGVSWYTKPSSGARKWFESPKPMMSKMIYPDAPSCFHDWIKTYGKFSLHVYFVENPWLIGC